MTMPEFRALHLDDAAIVHFAAIQTYDGQTREIAIVSTEGQVFFLTAVHNTYEGKFDPICERNEMPTLDHAYAQLVRILTRVI